MQDVLAPSCELIRVCRSVRRHEALQFLEPILNDDDSRSRLLTGFPLYRRDHQEPLAVACDIIVVSANALEFLYKIAFKEPSWGAYANRRWCQLYTDHHHLPTIAVEQFSPVRRPPR